MEYSFAFLVVSCLALYVEYTTSATAEYCKSYPGDISFAYSTTVDEDYWFQNYQNAYTGKKGGGPYTIYRRRTVITRRPRPRGTRPNQPAMNSVNNEIQQIQQQQVQMGPFPFTDVNQEDGQTNETEAESEKKPLPIWKITIPRQSSRAVIARIENAQVVESFELNSTHFQNPNLTATTTGSKIRHVPLSSTTAPSVSTRIIDITDQSMIPDAWYAVCIDVNIVEKEKPHTCNHCTLIKAREDNGRQQFLDFDWVPASFRNTSAELRYAAVDFPFQWAVIRSKAWTKYPNPRCQDQVERIVFESKDYAYPEHFTFLTVKNLVGKMSYGVQVDLEFPWKQEADGVLPKPFTLTDYLHSDTTSTTLAKCDDYSYKGD